MINFHPKRCPVCNSRLICNYQTIACSKNNIIKTKREYVVIIDRFGIIEYFILNSVLIYNKWDGVSFKVYIDDKLFSLKQPFTYSEDNLKMIKILI